MKGNWWNKGGVDEEVSKPFLSEVGQKPSNFEIQWLESDVLRKFASSRVSERGPCLWRV